MKFVPVMVMVAVPDGSHNFGSSGLVVAVAGSQPVIPVIDGAWIMPVNPILMLLFDAAGAPATVTTTGIESVCDVNPFIHTNVVGVTLVNEPEQSPYDTVFLSPVTDVPLTLKPVPTIVRYTGDAVVPAANGQSVSDADTVFAGVPPHATDNATPVTVGVADAASTTVPVMM